MRSEAEIRYYERKKALGDEFERALRPYDAKALEEHYRGQQDWGDNRVNQADVMAKFLQIPVELAQKFIEEKGGNSARFRAITIKENAHYNGEWALVEILQDVLCETPGRVQIDSEYIGEKYAITGKGKKMRSFKVYAEHNEAVYDDVMLANTMNFLGKISLEPSYPGVF